MTSGVIRFPNSPWPQGHDIAHLRMSVSADDDGRLRLHLDLDSVDYDRRPPSTSGATPWEDPNQWIEFKAATFSTTRWQNRGFALDLDTDGFDESALDGVDLRADLLADDTSVLGPLEDLACGVIVIGNNVARDHHLQLRRTGLNEFGLHWSGKLALTFIGEKTFDHEFDIVADGVRLS